MDRLTRSFGGVVCLTFGLALSHALTAQTTAVPASGSSDSVVVTPGAHYRAGGLPAGPLVVSPLLDAAGVIHSAPRLVELPDAPALGEFRAEFGGMLGMIEERPVGGPDGEPGFAGATKIVDTDELFERLEKHQ